MFALFFAQFSSNGLITFNDQLSSNRVVDFPRSDMPQVPIVAPLWTDIVSSQNMGILYARFVDDEASLSLVKQMLLRQNLDLADYQPSEAVIVTWHQVQLEGGPTVSIIIAGIAMRHKIN